MRVSGRAGVTEMLYLAVRRGRGIDRIRRDCDIFTGMDSGEFSRTTALEARSGAGFVDRLIHERYRERSAITTTFERKLGALEGAARLRTR